MWGKAVGAVGRAVSAVRRLPLWALVVVGIAVLAIVGEAAFLIVQTSGDDGGTQEVTEQPLPCTERQAQYAVNSDRFAQQVRGLGTVPPLVKVLDVYDVDVLDCVDLTGDEVDEMVVQLTESAADPEATGIAAPWAIYQPIDGEWVPSLVRTTVTGATVTIQGNVVREVSSALVEGDALCCPSGTREGVVEWTGKEFAYKPESGPRGRTIAVADGEAVALGGFPVQEGNLPDAVEFFGSPSTYGPDGNVCPAEWRDLGMRLDFANLGGLDPCGLDGRVGVATLQGLEARGAGWKTQEGARVDISEDALRKLYPDMTQAEEEAVFIPEAPEGELFTLIEAPSEVGVEELTPILSARIFGGRVVGFELQVGAAGE
jgi:hypothetical protein